MSQMYDKYLDARNIVHMHWGNNAYTRFHAYARFHIFFSRWVKLGCFSKQLQV